MTSQINPSNINENYPVAGQPNNTQGFRDNFSGTKTNFTFAANEINDLQTKAVLKSALTGTTLDNNMNDNLLYAVRLQDVSYSLVNVAATSGVITLDYSAGQYQQVNTTGSVSINFANFPIAGTVGSMRVAFNITNTAYTVTLPAVVSQGLSGLEGISPGTPGVSNTITFGVTGNYAFEFITTDGGLTVWIFDLSRPKTGFTAAVSIVDPTAATNTTTGALTVEGGVGIGGNLYVGGEIVGNVVVSGVNVTGNVQGGNLLANARVIATGNVTGGNLLTGGSISATGNVTANNVSISGNVLTNLKTSNGITAVGNVQAGNLRTAGIVSATGNVTGGNVLTTAMLASGAITTSSSSAGLGYRSGAGSTATQSTSKTNSVTLNNICGQVTCNNSQINGDATVTFTLINSAVAATDVIILNHVGGGNIGEYALNGVCDSGSANISIHNLTNTNRSDPIEIRFAVIKSVNS